MIIKQPDEQWGKDILKLFSIGIKYLKYQNYHRYDKSKHFNKNRNLQKLCK
jgi:hypothetical protein